MPRPARKTPTNTELEILQVLWEAGPSRLSEICRILHQRRPVATTTVATMLKVMLGKKLVKRGEGEGSPVWEAAVSHAKTNTGLVQDLIKRVFDGSSKNLILHLLETETLSDKDQQTIHKMLAKAAPGKKRKRGKPS